MKQSCYNIKFEESNGVILYNIATDGILQLAPQTAELLDSYADKVDDLCLIYPDLFNALKCHGFIVDDNVDETRALIDKWSKQFAATDTFRLTVNPTLNCNLCCWYCYESHSSNMVMSDDILERTKLLIRNKVGDKDLKMFNLDFFGGEPLLQFDRIVMPLISVAVEVCNQNGKQLHLSFTTNGVLLTPEHIAIIERQLKCVNGYKVVPSFQITLDGNRYFHDKVRKTPVGKGSYDAIMANIKVALSHGFDIFVRFNTTNENIDSYLDVIDDFADIPKEHTVHLQFDLQSVWQDNTSPQTREKLSRLSEELTAEGYRVQIHKLCNRKFCYADKENTAVVNYDGNVYKCTAREFHPELAEGSLSTDGRIIYNSRYVRRLALRFGNSVCRKCDIYPICHGGCTQDKIENEGLDICLRHYTNEERMKIVRERLRYLINNSKK